MIIYIQPRSREDLLMIMRSQRACDQKRVTLHGDEKNGALEEKVEILKSRVK